MAIPLLNRQGIPTGDLLEREQFHRSESILPKERRVHPAIHATVYDSHSRVLEQLRSKNKRLLPGIWLPVNGGHGDEKELYRQNSHYIFKWQDGAVRELREELGLIVEPRELRTMDEKLIDFTQVSGFENLAYLKLYSFRYDPHKHGEIKLNSSEIEEVRFRTPTYKREFNLLKVLGEEYASRIARKIVAGSKIISRR